MTRMQEVWSSSCSAQQHHPQPPGNSKLFSYTAAPPTVIQFLIVAFCFHGMMYYDISLSTYIWSMKWISPKYRLIWCGHTAPQVYDIKTSHNAGSIYYSLIYQRTWILRHWSGPLISTWTQHNNIVSYLVCLSSGIKQTVANLIKQW